MNRAVVAASRAANAGTRSLRSPDPKKSSAVGTGALSATAQAVRVAAPDMGDGRTEVRLGTWPVSPPWKGEIARQPSHEPHGHDRGHDRRRLLDERELREGTRAELPREQPVEEQPPESDRGLRQERDPEVAEHRVHPAPTAAGLAIGIDPPAGRLAGALPVERHVHILPTRAADTIASLGQRPA